MHRSVFPWQRFELDSAWSPADVERELPRAALLAKQAAPRWDGPPGDRRFHFTRRTARAVVVASVRVLPTAAGSRVLVTLRWPSRALLCLFIAGPITAVFGILAVVQAFVEGQARALLPWFIVLAVWPWTLRSFVAEARALEADLRAWFPPPMPPSLGPFR